MEDNKQPERDHRLSSKPKPHTRSTKEESEKINKRMLEMIQQNMSWREIYTKMKEELELQGKLYAKSSIMLRYTKLMEEIKQDNSSDIEAIRNSRIESLRRDIEEAYLNYQNSEFHPTTRQKWFEIYLNCKNNLDKFFPNALQPKEEKEDLNINISFVDA